jgi:Recombinase zinc beta ribbon domain
MVDEPFWEHVQADFRERQHVNHKPVQSEQKALLAGVLYCQSCQTPMMATYSMKRGHQYRYYVCRQALRQGWHACPTKAISASLIEESLVGQLRVRLDSEETRNALHLAQPDWRAFLHDPAGLVPALVEAVRYDGVSGTVSVQLRALSGNVPHR